MSSTQDPVHLSNHHRDTLARIFQHPVSHNIEWRAVRSLLDAVAEVDQRHDGRLLVTLGGETESFELPRSKDIETELVVDLRRMLRAAGYRSELDGVASDTT